MTSLDTRGACRSRPAAAATLVAILLACRTTAEAGSEADPPRDFVSLSGDAAELNGVSASSAQVTWLRSWNPSFTSRGGLDRSNVGNLRWSFVTLGGVLRTGARTVVHGNADIGSGRDGDARFAYRDYKVGVMESLVDQRLDASFEARRFGFRDVRASILTSGITIRDHGGRSYNVSYHTSVGGNLDVRTVVGRYETRVGRSRLFVGLAAGRSPVDPDLVDRSARSSFVEGFTGVASMLGRQEITVALDSFAGPGLRRNALQVGLRLSL